MVTELQWKTIEAYNHSAQQFDATIAKLPNYNETYDYLAGLLSSGDSILDLACGTASISAYIKAQKNVSVTGVDLSDEMLRLAKQHIKNGTFYKESIINFNINTQYHAVIIGFGLPYLDKGQTEQCLANAVKNTLDGQYLYISFMEGDGSRVEKTSFGGTSSFLIHYHRKDIIIKTLTESGARIIKEYELPYTESDGTITKDIVLIAQKESYANKK